MNSPTITSVYVFTNGMTAVFDSAGQQVPELQGRWNEKRAAIIEAAMDATCFYISRFTVGEIPITKQQAAKLSLSMEEEVPNE
jgi:hypothetical protein